MNIRWLPEAADDLEGIFEYLLENYPSFANSTVNDLYEAIRSLSTIPFRGRPGRKPNIRELVLPRLPYIVFYRVANQTVEILYIRHGAQERPPD